MKKLLKFLSAILIFAVAPVMFFSGCAANMPRYYADLKAKLDMENYPAAAEFVDGSKEKYGKKNVLLYYLDSGFANHLADNYSKSSKSFDSAKRIFEDNYQKSISAGAASFVFNDNALPYYGQDYERAHTTIFEALNYVLSGADNEAVVEARQVDTMFKTFSANANGKNIYKDDGFIRYFMGLVYENGGYLNDAHVSYFAALKAYGAGLADIAAPQDLIDDAYTTALLLGLDDRAREIKKEYQSAKKILIPKGFGECVIVSFNGYIPEKIPRIFEFALLDAWGYINEVKADKEEEKEFEQARSITISAFAKDYIKVVFPEYKNVPNKIVSFGADSNGGAYNAYKVQSLSDIAKKCLKDDIGKIYAKTIARAAVKYIIGKSVSAAVGKNTAKGWGALTQVAFNVYSAVSEDADIRGWQILPEDILMSRFFLPEGENDITINFSDADGAVLKSENIKISIREGKKNFIALRSSLK
jgi:hypothetical protein